MLACQLNFQSLVCLSSHLTDACLFLTFSLQERERGGGGGGRGRGIENLGEKSLHQCWRMLPATLTPSSHIYDLYVHMYMKASQSPPTLNYVYIHALSITYAHTPCIHTGLWTVHDSHCH